MKLRDRLPFVATIARNSFKTCMTIYLNPKLDSKENLNELFSNVAEEDISLCKAIAALYGHEITDAKPKYIAYEGVRPEVFKLAKDSDSFNQMSSDEAEHVVNCTNSPVSAEEYILLSRAIDRRGIMGHSEWQKALRMEDEGHTVCGLPPHMFKMLGTKECLGKAICDCNSLIKLYSDSYHADSLIPLEKRKKANYEKILESM